MPTVQDLLDEQTYHRRLSRSHLRLHGYGIVQGLTVNATKKGSIAVINSGFGITRSGQAVAMDDV